MELLAQIFAGLVAGTLGAAAFAKLKRPSDTQRALQNWKLPSTKNAVWLLAGVELLSAVAVLLIPAWGALLAALLLGAFTVALLIQLAKGNDLDCPCFGATSSELSMTSVIRNAFLFASCFIAQTASATGLISLTRFGVAAVAMAFLLSDRRYVRV